MTDLSNDDIRQMVRRYYGQIGKGERGSCCPPSGDSGCCGSSPPLEQITNTPGYSQDESEAVPEGANLGLGCGNPQAIAGLVPGETVLDLGAGGGFDCFLAARAVGPSGKVIGVDMTSEMLSKARQNAEKFASANVEFRLGEIENLPVADNTVDVIVSNCVINLSPDKPRVFREAYRVLKPGGRLAIADIVATAEIPQEVRMDLEMLAGCVAGAATTETLKKTLVEIGFEDVSITARNESAQTIAEWFPGRRIEDFIVSAEIKGTKPR